VSRSAQLAQMHLSNRIIPAVLVVRRHSAALFVLQHAQELIFIHPLPLAHVSLKIKQQHGRLLVVLLLLVPHQEHTLSAKVLL